VDASEWLSRELTKRVRGVGIGIGTRPREPLELLGPAAAHGLGQPLVEERGEELEARRFGVFLAHEEQRHAGLTKSSPAASFSASNGTSVPSRSPCERLPT